MKKKIVTIVMCIVMITSFTFSLTACGNSEEGANSSSSTIELSDGKHITLTDTLPACNTEDNLKKLNDAMYNKNESLKNEMLALGEVIVIQNGEGIDVIDYGALHTKIQYNGQEYWTNTDFIK